MIILGIDPGFAILGYGVLNYDSNKFSVLDYGAITTSSKLDLDKRLLYIGNTLDLILEKYKPDDVSIEKIFFNKNVKTALSVAQARGIAIYLCAAYRAQIFEYTPLQVKQSMVGYGRAEKIQVQQMVKLTLKLSEIPKPDDVADALALAVCHAHMKNQHYSCT